MRSADMLLDENVITENEVVEKLEGDLVIIANPMLYRYTSDSVRLAKSVMCKAQDSILDLCCGGGIVALMMAACTTAKRIIGVELQQPLADMARRSCKLNNLQERVVIEQCNLKDYDGNNGFAVVTCNPPYYKVDTGMIREQSTVDVARHELECSLRDIVACSARALKYGGKLYMVHKCERMAEVLSILKTYRLEPKKLTIYSSGGKQCDTFIVMAKSGAKEGMLVEHKEL